MLWQTKRWSLQKRSLIVAACAVGATAIVVAGIFTFALIRADFTSDQKVQRQLAAAGLHIVEREIESRLGEVRNAAMRIEALEPSGDARPVLGALQFGASGYNWVGLTDEGGKVIASSGKMLEGHGMAGANWFRAAMAEGSALTSGPDPNDPLISRLGARADRQPWYLIHVSQRIAGRGVLTAAFQAGIAEVSVIQVLSTLGFNHDTILVIEGPGIQKRTIPAEYVQMEVKPAGGSALHKLGWSMILAQPPDHRTVPDYAFMLTAIAVAVGVAGVARGISWASRPALLLADAASQRIEIEGLLECGEIPPDLVPMSRQIISLHRVSQQRTARLQEMLLEMTTRFNELTSNFPGVIFRRIVEGDGSFRYIYVSPSCRKYFGVEAEDMLADATIGFRNFNPEDAARVRNLIRSMQSRASGAVLTQYRVTGSDGVMRWMQALAEPHVSVSGELVWEGVAVDISALKAAEARAQELRQQEQEARLKADAENQAKSRFLAVMSHEIRNPLNSIAGYARLLQERAGDQGEIREYAHVIEQSSGHLELLVSDILDFSKIEAGRVSIDQSGFSLSEVVAFLQGQMAVLASGKPVSFELLRETDACQVLGDRMRLTQVLMNLLTNAFKFTPEGKVVLAISEIARGERDVTLRFRVTDTGIGMNANALSRIFQPFEQADPSSSRRFGGTGLGLAIAQRLARLMDSEIHVSSEPGKGSSFWLDLSLGMETRGTVRRSTGRHAPPIVSGGLKVLIADDNEVNSRLLAAMLGARGYECRTVSSGAAALAALGEGAYGVLLLDIDMPEMDGYEVAARIRQFPDAAVRDMRIVAITGNAFAEDVKKALESGIDDHMAKPTDFDALFRLLREEELARGVHLKSGAVA